MQLTYSRFPNMFYAQFCYEKWCQRRDKCGHAVVLQAPALPIGQRLNLHISMEYRNYERMAITGVPVNVPF